MPFEHALVALAKRPHRNCSVEKLTERAIRCSSRRPTQAEERTGNGGGFAFASAMPHRRSLHSFDGERQWHTRRQSFAAESLPTVDLALLAGPALFARLHDDRTFNVRAQTIGRARTSSAPGPPLSGLLLFSRLWAPARFTVVIELELLLTPLRFVHLSFVAA